MSKLAEIRKVAVVIVGIVAVLLAQHVLSGSAEQWAETLVALATVAGVYQVPNAQPTL